VSALHRSGAGWAGAGLLASAVVVDGWTTMALSAWCFGAVLLVYPVPLVPLGRRTAPFAFFALLALVFGAIGGGETLVAWGPLHVGKESLARASLAACRLLLAGASAAWLGLALGTSRLLRALQRAGRFTKRLGVDLTVVLLALGVAIRFLPLLQEEARLRRSAWEARGAGLLARGVCGRARSAGYLTVPLLAAALRRAEALAEAIEARLGGEALSQWASMSSVGAVGAPGNGPRRGGLVETVRPWAGGIAGWLPVAVRIWQWVG